MLHWFRAHLRPFALAALVSLAGLASLSSVVHDSAECHDECAAGVVAHDPWSHAIGSTTSGGEQALHCILCHWTRTVRPSTEAAHEMARPVTCDVRSIPDSLGSLLRVLQAQPPLRSPPITATA